MSIGVSIWSLAFLLHDASAEAQPPTSKFKTEWNPTRFYPVYASFMAAPFIERLHLLHFLVDGIQQFTQPRVAKVLFLHSRQNCVENIT